MEAQRKRILEMVQQGRITVEQADRLLEALQQSYRVEAPHGRERGQPHEDEPPPTGTDWGDFGRSLARKIQRQVTAALGAAAAARRGATFAAGFRAKHRPHQAEAVLTTCALEEGVREVVVDCHTGELELLGAEGETLRLIARKPIPPGEQLPDGWEKDCPWSAKREGTQQILTLGDPQHRRATADITFCLEIPAGIAVRAHTRGGDITARSLSAKLELDTGGGDAHVSDIEGPVTVKTAGGDAAASDVRGEVGVETAGGDAHVSDIEGPATVKTAGGDAAASDVRGDVMVATSGGDIAVNDIVGSVTVKSEGGDVSVTDVDGDAVIKASGGDTALTSISGSVKTG